MIAPFTYIISMPVQRTALAIGFVLALVCTHALVSAASMNRGDAFIGYKEHNELKCKDFHPDCVARAAKSHCLTDPFHMRRFCPLSCVVEPCGFQGTVRHIHQGHATKDGTFAYRAYFEGDSSSRAAVGPDSAGPVTTAQGHFRDILNDDDNTTLAISSLGIGTYLGENDKQTDEAVITAVIYGIMRGWNVIDTACNYRCAGCSARGSHHCAAH